ncbi:glycosyl hydrolase [Niabella aurantiaca]|uniref:glycosyl hydrolase n=1 Tax=Niabella aurantiaca TaxID=379900 RepID=UPI00035D5E42|nr:glycosyl hydrolase [Niabella aurantiaca]
MIFKTLFPFFKKHKQRSSPSPGWVLLFPSFFISAAVFAQSLKKPPAPIPFSTISRNFYDPGKEFQTAPLWVWNTRVTTGMIDSMLQEFKANAFGGVFIHPRPGLITEYLGDEWLSLYKHAVQKAAALDMHIWIYDENSYPTGFAGGLVPDQMPGSYNQGQMLQLFRSDTVPGNRASYFICLKKEGDHFTEVTAGALGKGDYYLFRKLSYTNQAGMVGPPNYPLVDLLVKGVTEKFIDITFSGYKKAFGDAFGKTVPGTFSDEPSIPTHGSLTTRWTPDLFAVFKEKWGYDLVPHLPSLFEETGDWRKIRHNYQETLLQLFIDRWSKPMQAFTQKNHLKWTGHYWEHGWPDPGEGPDNMAMYAWHDQPGIDMLFNQFNESSPNAQFGNIRSVKELSSVANQLGKERTLCETYGGAGWDLTFKDMKRLGDWQAALGVNFMNQHLAWMSMAGARKYDYPTTFSYQNSWWPYYRSLNEYFARLSYALSRGIQKNDILILEPTSTAWMYHSRVKSNPRFFETGTLFQSFITRLEKAQAEYDLGSENIIKDHGSVYRDQFRIGNASYKTVVIPPGMENVNKETYLLLRQFVANGGKLVLFNPLSRIDGAAMTPGERFSDDRRGVAVFTELDDTVIDRIFRSPGFSIHMSTPPPEGGSLLHHRRIIGDGQLLFLSNANLTQPAAGYVDVNGNKFILMMDLSTGTILNYPQTARQQGTRFSFDIPPAGSALFFIADHRQKAGGTYRQLHTEEELKGSAITVQRPAANTLMIDFCDLQIAGSEKKDLHVRDATQLVFKENGFSRDPWDHQMQFRTDFVQRDTFSRGSGFTVSYHFSIGDRVDAKNFRAVIEQGHLWNDIRVNGHPLTPGNSWWLDRSFTVLNAGPYLKEGNNTLSLTIDPMSIYAEIGPVFLLGDYNLESAAKGWKIVPPKPLTTGSWRKQGLPMYGHAILYKKDYTLDAPGNSYVLRLDSLKGSLAAVRVNGKNAGIVYADPYLLDVSKLLKKGKNRIEVTVVGSLRNLMGPHYKSYRPGYTGPDSWSGITGYPAGHAYILFDYGLNDIRLFRNEKD